MNKTAKISIAVIVVVIIIGGVWALMAARPASSPSNSTSTSQGGSNAAVDTVTLTYDANGFSPSSATVKAGGTVKIVNNSRSEIEFASNPHPTHTDNPELNTSDIEPGKDATITVNKKGTWGFHNHYDHTKGGTLTVE